MLDSMGDGLAGSNALGWHGLLAGGGSHQDTQRLLFCSAQLGKLRRTDLTRGDIFQLSRTGPMDEMAYLVVGQAAAQPLLLFGNGGPTFLCPF